MKQLEFGWFLPTRGDTDDYGDPMKIAAGSEMFERVTKAAEDCGFEYMLIPVGHQCFSHCVKGRSQVLLEARVVHRDSPFSAASALCSRDFTVPSRQPRIEAISASGRSS